MLYDEIYDKAKSLISLHKTNDPKTILEDRGVFLIPFRSKTRLLGMYSIVKEKSFVFYNPNLDSMMLRMVLAHELGHDIYHKKEARDRHFHEFELFNINNTMETEANLFACHLLIDEKDVQELASEGYTYDQIAASLGVNVNLLLFKISEMNRRGKSYKLDMPLERDFFKKINGKEYK